MTAASPAGGAWRGAPFALLGDERLAQRVGAGDERAFAVVYERYHQMLYRYCRSILRDEADAQDALQSTFAAAFAALRTGQRDAPMRPWLFRIAHNESVSALRRRRPASALPAPAGHGTTSIDDVVTERAELSMLLRDLHDLTDRQRSALVLRELSGLSHQEIAIALGISVGAAKQTIFEARRSLFEFAEGRAMACDEIRKTISDADGRVLRGRRIRAHLRECTGCAAFAAAIPNRTGQLRAFAPALPAAAGAGLFGRTVVTATGRSGGSGLAPIAAGAAAKTAAVGAGFGANALAGVAVVASATAGVTVGVDRLVHAMAHRAAAGDRPPLTAPAPARHPASLVKVRGARGALSAGGLGPSESAGETARSSHAGSGVRLAGDTLRSESTHAGTPTWARGSGTGGRPGAGAVAGARGSQAYYGANPRGDAWHGKPARVPSGQASSASSSSAAAGHSGSSHGGSARSANPSEMGSGNGSQPGAGAVTVNVPASVSAAVGSVPAAAGSLPAAAGNVSATVGSVTRTVSGILPVAPLISPASVKGASPISLP
ncbi:MAG TPA: RNA polymerase sigma factor [Solirubrobacteraceae bacterium]|nr:RNA polymerase sigma factor [Solirubrobacteraceae bacterium]